MPKTVPQIKTDTLKFDAQTIRECQRYVRSVQRKLDRAVAEGNRKKIRLFTWLLSKRSRAVRILAVYRATIENEGKNTAGGDGMKVLEGKTEKEKKHNSELREWLITNADIKKKPSPIRRTYIKKSNGKLRPLGIPTLLDRVIQDVLRTVIEPITEYHANDNSYGFRPKRNCQDAIEHLFRKLSQRTSKQWVIEGDIKGCFDSIKHDHITKQLTDWNTPNFIVKVIEKMLKSKILEHETLNDPQTGTPQGGILSPMLANVAITTMDNFCTKYDRRSNPIVRYADDFVIICKSEEEAKKIKKEIAEMLKKEIGLTLNDEKTMITNIHQGFNFLGFNIRKYPQNSPHSKYHKVGKLIIKPQPEKVILHLKKIENILKENRTAKQESIIRILNPILQGFALFYRFAVSQKTYSWVRNSLWNKLWKWAKRRHPNKPAKWIMKKYFTTNGRKWMFKSEDGQNSIIDVEKIPILRYVKVKAQMRVHDGSEEAIEYFRKRERINALDQIYSVKVEKLFKRQKGMCIYCDSPITQEQIRKGLVHIHHMNPRTQGGDEKLNNLLLCHQECHKEAHSIMSRELMSYWWNLKGNYMKKENIRAFAVRGKVGDVKSVEREIKIQRLERIIQRKREASRKRAERMLKEGRI